MSIAAVSSDFGTFSQIHDFIKQQKIPPSAKFLWGELFGFYRQHGIVYVCRSYFAKRLNLSTRTISNGLNLLKKLGFIKFTGEFKFSFYPCFDLVSPYEDNDAVESRDSQPVSKISATAEGRFSEQGTFVHTKQSKQAHIKERTTVVAPPPSKKEFSSNEKIALKQKLKAFGVHKHVIDKLLGKHSMEKINAQLEHLQQVIDRAGIIENPAAWLMAAIKNDYSRPKEQSKSTLENEQRADAVKKATVIAQSAKAELMEGKLKEAVDLCTKSSLLAENTLANEVRREVEQMLEQKQKIERARQLVSAEKLELIRREEEQKKLKEMRRWNKNDAQMLASTFFKEAVEALVNQRLLAVT